MSEEKETPVKKKKEKVIKEVVPPKLNAIIYLGTSFFEHKKEKHYFGAGHGYVYDENVEGKKKLVKDVPTKNGYYTNNPQLGNEVVSITDYINMNCVNPDTQFSTYLGLVERLKKLSEDSELRSFYFITDNRYLFNFLTKKGLKQVKENKKFGKLELTTDEVSRYEALIPWLEGKTISGDTFKHTVDANSSVEGGLGNKSLSKQLSLSEAFSRASDSSKTVLAFMSKKEFESPVIDFNKIVCGNRWFFNTGGDTKYYDEIHGFRAYSFGMVESKKKYYGKLTPDVTFSKLFTKEPIELLDRVFEYSIAETENKDGYFSAATLDLVKSRDLYRLMDTLPAINKKNNLIMPHRVGAVDEPVLVELIDPPMMSYVVRERLNLLNNGLKAFLDKDDSNKFKTIQYIDITDSIYTKEPNKKGEIKVKLHPDLKPNVDKFIFKVDHPNAKKQIPLTVSLKYDLPERNCLNSVDCPNVKVWLAVDTKMEKGLTFHTLVETDKFIYILTNSVGNLRVLSLKELKE